MLHGEWDRIPITSLTSYDDIEASDFMKDEDVADNIEEVDDTMDLEPMDLSRTGANPYSLYLSTKSHDENQKSQSGVAAMSEFSNHEFSDGNEDNPKNDHIVEHGEETAAGDIMDFIEPMDLCRSETNHNNANFLAHVMRI